MLLVTTAQRLQHLDLPSQLIKVGLTVPFSTQLLPKEMYAPKAATVKLVQQRQNYVMADIIVQTPIKLR